VIWLHYILSTIALCTIAYGASFLKTRTLRWATVCALVVFLITLFFTSNELLGRPKDTGREYLLSSTKAAVVTGSYVSQGKTVYIMLYNPQWYEPRLYSIAWENGGKEVAEQLREAQRSRKKGEPIIMNSPFQHLLKSEWFDPPPQSEAQPKPDSTERGAVQL